MEINKYSNTVQVDSNYLINALEEGMKLFNLSNKLIDSIVPFIEDKSKYDLDNGTILLDKLEELTSLNVKTVESFHLNAVSGYQDLRRRLFDTFESYYRLLAIINPTLDAFIPLDMDELNEVLELLKRMSGHLGIFIMRQFEFETSKENMEFAVEVYLGNHKMGLSDLETLYTYMMNKVNEYRPRIETFDEYPHLEEQFMEKVGPWFYDIDYIKYEDVIAVIEDKLDPEDLKVKLNGGSNGDL